MCADCMRLYVCSYVQGAPPLDEASDAWLAALHPYQDITLVNEEGASVMPARCSLAEVEGRCRFVRVGDIAYKKPVLAGNGPVFVRIPRLRCTEHKGECQLQPTYKAQFGAGRRLKPDIIIAGKVRESQCNDFFLLSAVLHRVCRREQSSRQAFSHCCFWHTSTRDS